MKKLKFLIIPIFCVLLGAILFGCNNSADHVVILNSVGGSGMSTTRVSVNGSQDIAFPASPTKTGYTFVGWYEEDYETKIEKDYFTDHSDVKTLYAYAKWQANTYTVTYDYQEATGGVTVQSNKVTYGDIYTLPNPTKTGYVFCGWYTKENGLGNLIIDTTKSSIDRDHILYAYWVKESEILIKAADYVNKGYKLFETVNATGKDITIESCGDTFEFNYLPDYYTFTGSVSAEDKSFFAYGYESNGTYYSFADEFGFSSLGGDLFVRREGGQDVYYRQNKVGCIRIEKPDSANPTYVAGHLAIDKVKSQEKVTYADEVVKINDAGYYQIGENLYYKRVGEADNYYQKNTEGYIPTAVGEDVSSKLVYTPVTMIEPVKEDNYYYIEGENYRFKVRFTLIVVEAQSSTGGENSEQTTTKQHYLQYIVYNEEMYIKDTWYNYNTIKQTLYSTISTINSTNRVNYGDVITCIGDIADTYWMSFDGWYLEGTDEQYINKKSVYDIDGTMCLVARFSPKQVIINFNSYISGAVISSPTTKIFAPKSYDIGSLVSLEDLPVPTKVGYSFIGWTLDKDWKEHAEEDEEYTEEDYILSEDFFIYADCVLYPVWQESTEFKTYLFNYDGKEFVKYGKTGDDMFLDLTPTEVEGQYTFTYNEVEYTFVYDSEDELKSRVLQDDKTAAPSNKKQLVFNINNETFVYGGDCMIVAPKRNGYVFNYWVENPYTVSVAPYKFTTLTRDVMLYADYTPARYTIVFNRTTGAGEPYQTSTISFDKSISSVFAGSTTDGTKNLYRWYYVNKDGEVTEITTESIEDIIDNIVIGDKIDLYPIWIEKDEKIVLSFNVDGRKYEEREVALNSALGELPYAIKVGHYFLGWYYTIDGKEYRLEADDIWSTGSAWRDEATYDENTGRYVFDINARFIPRLYSIVIRFNNGSILNSFQWLDVAVPTGTNVTLPEFETFAVENEGYDFVEYNTKADGTGTSYKGGDEFKVTTTTNLYAIWKPKKSVIYFLDENGSALEGMSTQEIAYGSKIGSFPYIIDITNKNRGFAGWAIREEDNPTDNLIIISETYSFKEYAEQYQLYATWDSTYNYIRYMSYDIIDNEEVLISLGSNFTDKIVQGSSSVLQKPTRIPTREGYVFSRWVDRNGDDFEFGRNVYEDTYVYSEWLKVTDVVMSYGVEGSDVKVPKMKLTEGQKVGMMPVPTRVGYTLEGWYTGMSGQGEKITEDTTWDNNSTILYANWKRVDNENTFYKVRLFVEGSVTEGSYTSLTVNRPQAPNKAGFAFVGWYTAEEGGELFDFDNTMIESDINLYARFA